MKILLCVTGSVAATLTPQLIEALKQKGTVDVMVTEHALNFWKPTPAQRAWRDRDEWVGGYTKGEAIHHIELRKWADVGVIAPLTASTLAKFANGIADNLVTSTLRAWQIGKPIVIAPAMNTEMWNHPVTAEHLATLQRWFGSTLTVVPPVSKTLACGDEGIGAMAAIQDIVAALG